MKRLILASLLLLSTAVAEAQTKATWDRNGETDMDHYNVYVCVVKGCVPSQSPSMLQPGHVVQPAPGVRPEWLLPVGKEGALAVSAVDQNAQESGLSNVVPFDKAAPMSPVGVRLD